MNRQRFLPDMISPKLVPVHLLLVSAPVMWAGNFIVGRALRGEMPPISLNFWRWTVALAILLPLNLRRLRRHWPLLRVHWRLVLALGLTGVTGFNTFAYLALSATTAVNALLFLSTVPLLMALLSHLAFKEPVSARQTAGIFLSLPGAAILIAHGHLTNLLHMQFNRGDVWMLGAVLVWTVFSVLLNQAPRELPKATLLTATVLVGLAAFTPIYVWRLALGERATFTVTTVAGMLYVGLFASVIAFYFWSKGMAQVGPGKGGVYMNLMPLAGTFFAITLLGESLAHYHLLGGALVAAGIVLTHRPQTALSRIPPWLRIWPRLTKRENAL